MNDKPELTAEEEKGLALVDNLLKKANKAREIQKKVRVLFLYLFL